MTKRSIDSASPSPAPERPIPAPAERQATRKNDRSHEENQERAYIAASRRADRSIEARVQSARMASEIHKKRTGKGFKITEEIVMKEEMYEEEEDDLPRQYRAFAAHLHTTSPDMNNRVNAYLTNQVALASLAHQQEIDRIFAEHFPLAAHQAAHMQQPGHPLQTFQFGNHQYARARTQSMPDAMSPRSTYQRVNTSGPSTSTPHSSVDEQMSFAASSASGSRASRATPITSYSGEDLTTKQILAVPVDPSLTMSPLPNEQPPSPFTSELPAETQLLLGSDINDQIMSAMYAGELLGSEDYFSQSQGAVPYMQTTYGQPITTQDPPHTNCDLPGFQSQGTQIRQPPQAGESITPSAHVDFDQWLTDPNVTR